MPAAVDAVRRAADALAGLGLPVFFYGEAASEPGRAALADHRRGGLARLGERMASGEWLPDRGPNRPHPTGGVVCVGARRPLVAFNLLLDTDRVGAAKRIAASLRESGGGPPGVRALGFFLEGRGQAQVSVNLTDCDRTSLLDVVGSADETGACRRRARGRDGTRRAGAAARVAAGRRRGAAAAWAVGPADPGDAPVAPSRPPGVRVGRPAHPVRAGGPAHPVRVGRPAHPVRVGRPAHPVRVGRPAHPVLHPVGDVQAARPAARRRGMASKAPDDMVTRTSSSRVSASTVSASSSLEPQAVAVRAEAFDVRRDLLRVEALLAQALAVEHRGQEDAVGRGKRRRQVGRELPAASAQAPRLEQGDQPAAGEALPERRERRRDFRGMVGEVVDDDHARSLADDFEPTPDATERGERLQDGVPLEPVGAGRRPHGHRVQRVVLAPEAEVDPLTAGVVLQHERDPALATLDRADEPKRRPARGRSRKERPDGATGGPDRHRQPRGRRNPPRKSRPGRGSPAAAAPPPGSRRRRQAVRSAAGARRDRGRLVPAPRSRDRDRRGRAPGWSGSRSPAGSARTSGRGRSRKRCTRRPR